jgi:hypothetical protein
MPITLDVDRQPWRCDSCGLFVFNKDENGHPAPGAPPSFFGGEHGGKKYENVCAVCYEMKDAASSDYWRDIQRKQDEARAARIAKFNAQGGGVK